jgi:hypothetical protein
VTFVKLGQLLSTRRDLIPEEFITELARLQDQAEPVPWGQIEEVLAQSLGRPADEVFAELQPETAAAASIGQVHKACSSPPASWCCRCSSRSSGTGSSSRRQPRGFWVQFAGLRPSRCT